MPPFYFNSRLGDGHRGLDHADAFEFHPQRLAGGDIDDARVRAGGYDFARLQAFAAAVEKMYQPGERRQGMSAGMRALGVENRRCGRSDFRVEFFERAGECVLDNGSDEQA